MRKCNVVVAAASVALGCLTLYLCMGLSGYDGNGVPGERYWPGIIAWALIVLGGLQAFAAWRMPGENAARVVDLDSPAVRAAYAAALMAAAYGILLLCAGFIVATLVFIPAMMGLMGERRLWVLAVTAIAVVGVIYVFFALVFNTTLPASVFFE